MAILVGFPEKSAKIPTNQKFAKLFDSIFGGNDGEAQVGHAGIVNINGDTGDTKYFDFGRYDRSDLDGVRGVDEGAVRSSKNFSGLSIPNWDFSLSKSENVTNILTKLHNSSVFKGYGTIMGALAEGLDSKKMLKYATQMEAMGYHPFGGYSSSTNSSNPTYCAKFARGVAGAGGYDFSFSVMTGQENVDDVYRSNKLVKVSLKLQN
jgi:hypothetical protein